jgi:nucleotide-binding universal stress UspA family protein
VEIAAAEQVERSRILASLSGAANFSVEDPGTPRVYCERLAGLLHSRLTFHRPASGESMARTIARARDCDLVMFFDPGLSKLEEVLFGPAGKRASGGTPAAVVIVHQLRWPPQEILLAIRIKTHEAPAVSWAGRLAYLFDARLTILPLIPFQPGDFQWGGRQQDGIECLLAPSMPTGELFRALLKPISQWPINGTLRLRQGDPAEQASLEVARGHYDLIVAGQRRPER